MTMKDVDKQPPAAAQANEGEGNRTAARAYDRKAEAFAKSGKVEQKAKEAELAVDGPEGEDLARAEAAGKKRATLAGRPGSGKP
jgi:hypothetical protein